MLLVFGTHHTRIQALGRRLYVLNITVLNYYLSRDKGILVIQTLGRRPCSYCSGYVLKITLSLDKGIRVSFEP